MSKEPRIPRPGIDCSIVISLEYDQRKELTEHEQAQLEANLNDRFVEPQTLGELSLTFRSNVTQHLVYDVVISTSSSLMDDDTMDEIIRITEDTLDVNINSWEIDTKLSRKGWDIDEKLRFR